MPNQSASLRELALQVKSLDRRVRGLSSPQLANSAIENGAVRAYDGNSQTMQIGRQWDGTYTAAVTNGPTPPTPSSPIVTDGTEGLSVRWDGTFAGGLLAAPMDYLRVDIHISATDGFTPDFSNRYGTIVPPTGGEVAFALPAGTYYVRLVCWSQAGVPSAASAQVEGDSWPIAAGTDGFAPSTSPAAEVIGGYEVLSVRWTPISNADPVTYKIYVGTAPGFTKDSTTFVGTSTGSQFTLKLLPGVAPTDPNDPDPRKLEYDTTYYVAIVASDDDGDAAPGAEGSAQIFKIEGGAIGYQTIIGDNILGNSITADKFSSTLVLASEIWTSMTGQRVGMTPAGFVGYKPDGTLMLNFPTDPTQSALLDADLIARSLTLVGNMVMRSNNNSVEKDAILKLRNGVSAPIATPVMSIAWGGQTTQFSTASLSNAQKTGALGLFDFKGSEVSCIEWKSSGSYWVVHQIRPAGTRAWFFDYFGAPKQVSTEWFHDYTDWEVWSVVEMTTSPGKNGVYRMARYIPSGTDMTYYLWSPFGLNRYSRQNGSAPPVLGNNGTDVYTAEVINTDDLLIRYFTPNGDGNNLSAPFATYTSTTGYNASRPLSTVFYSASGFDIGSPRYLTAERGFSGNNKLLNVSGTSLYPGGSGNNWASANVDAESFEVAHPNPRCIAYDGSNFWTMGGDGVMYQHTQVHWDPAVRSSTIWAQYSYYDGDAAGSGTHETTPGPASSFYQKRRSAVQFWVPPIPGTGGVDEAKQVSLYVGLGASKPANSGMWWQADSNTTIMLEDFETTGTGNPPTVNSFPNTNPGKIQSEDGSMVISGDGTIQFGSTSVGAELARYANARAVHIRTTSGTANFVKPTSPAARFHWVRIWGPGGQGGGAASGSGTSEGGGGGGGAYVEKWYLDSELSASEPYTIGAGGSTGAAGAAGQAGTSASTFKGLSAGAGGGGGAMTSNTTSQAALGGAGGVGSGGDLNSNGDDGGTGRTILGVAVFGNHGGSSPGGGGRTQQGDFSEATAPAAGKSPGGGGAGAFAAGVSRAGAAGAAGKILIVSFY